MRTKTGKEGERGGDGQREERSFGSEGEGRGKRFEKVGKRRRGMRRKEEEKEDEKEGGEGELVQKAVQRRRRRSQVSIASLQNSGIV